MKRLILSTIVLLSATFVMAAQQPAIEGQQPLFVLNGKVITIDELKVIPSEDIESMTLLSKEHASEYALLGNISNGVFVITLKEDDSNLIFLEADVMPQFMGGDVNTFTMWLYGQIRYPEQALKNNIQGKVVVSFVVGSDGYISPNNIEFFDDCDAMLHDEVRRVLLSSASWTPAVQNGKNVAVRYTLPVVFKL